MAYEKACSIKNATVELNKLITTITTIQAVLIDAERKQSESEAVKIWVKRVKDVLYDADDLFDEVDADYMLRQQMKGNNVSKTVRVSFSWLNPILSRNSIAIKVKSIRESLLAISKDMKMFNFAVGRDDAPIGRIGEGRDQGGFVDSESIIGRDKDKEVIMEMLLHESKKDVRVIAIVGIGGMGKTTLAQLVYNDKEVENSFDKKWFACISDSTSDIEVYEKIFQSIGGNSNNKCSVNILQNKIKELIEGKKFFLVLDDVWDDDCTRWDSRIRLLNSGGKGSKIIVSTRSEAVAKAVGGIKEGAFQIHNLHGLSEEDSWNLFKSICLTPHQEKDRKRIHLGRAIMKKCSNLPLAIKTTARLLSEKDTIQEWESISNEKLPWLGEDHKDGVLSVLKLSYDYLPSNLKHCFAYCSLFPKDHQLDKNELINLWIAQGYISLVNKSRVVEDIGHSYFMHLLRRSFLQTDGGNYIMHDLMHDLAMHVAGDEISLLSNTSSFEVIGIRHASVDFVVDVDLHGLLLHGNRLRSLFLTTQLFLMTMSQPMAEFSSCKYLRALKLAKIRMRNLPSCIGELKHLRYLDISTNYFKELPDSITKLVNLCTLNIKWCSKLELLPSSFGKLVSLRHFYNKGCVMLKHLPAGFEELTCLQNLNEFRVYSKVKNEGQTFQLDGLSQLKLRGKLWIRFEDDSDDWDGIDSWQPPLFLEKLHIIFYKGIQIPNFKNGMAAKLTTLRVENCPSVKCVPSFKYLPNIKHVALFKLYELEYIEEEDGDFIPDLELLIVFELPKLKAWSRKECSESTFPGLTHLYIVDCPRLISLPMCPSLEHLHIERTRWEQIQDLKVLLSPSLVYLFMKFCHGVVRFWGKYLTSLQRLELLANDSLEKVELPPLHLNNLEKLNIQYCLKLELWEENNRGVDWDSLPKLRQLTLDMDRIPSSERLPECLRHLQQLGKLQIIES